MGCDGPRMEMDASNDYITNVERCTPRSADVRRPPSAVDAKP